MYILREGTFFLSKRLPWHAFLFQYRLLGTSVGVVFKQQLWFFVNHETGESHKLREAGI